MIANVIEVRDGDEAESRSLDQEGAFQLKVARLRGDPNKGNRGMWLPRL